MKKTKKQKSIKKSPIRKFRVTYEKPFLPSKSFSQLDHYIKITEIVEAKDIVQVIENLRLHQLYDNGRLVSPITIHSIKELENENKEG